MGIVRFALRFPYTFYGLAALIVFLGISAIRVMPIDIFPEINIPVVNVIWQYTGLSTPEMEQRISTYSQYAISTSVSGIKNMEAQTLTAFPSRRSSFNRTSISTWPSHKSFPLQIIYACSCRPESKRRSS